jgi:hypothetical protein
MRLKTPKVFDERTFSKLIDEVSDNNSSTLNAISLASKFNAASIENNPDCCIIDIQLLPSNYETYPHTLGVIPKYWITLRCSGASPTEKIVTFWNATHVSFANYNSALDLTATILLFK